MSQVYSFKISPHLVLPEREKIECWRDGVLVAGIFPQQDGISIVSEYVMDIQKEGSDTARVIFSTHKRGER